MELENNSSRIEYSKPYILLIESEEATKKAYISLLETLDCEVDAISNIQQAKSAFYIGYQLVLFSHDMPDDGLFQAVIEFKTKCLSQPNVPLVWLSAYPYEYVEEIFKKAPFDGFIKRTHYIDDLKDALEPWLKRLSKNNQEV